MSIDNFDRQTFIAFSMGVIVAKGGFVFDNCKISMMIDRYLIELKQPVMTREESETIIEQVDNLMYLFRLETSNRKQFRRAT